MKTAQNLERRDKARLPYVCPISVKDQMSDKSYSARMVDCSDTGVYFECDALLESGAEVYIGLRHSPFEDRPGDYICYRTTIMWRKELKEDRGMLFVFTEPGEKSFWMKNTYLPLDIAFVAPDGSILNILGMKPLDEGPRYLSLGPALYAIEASVARFVELYDSI